MNRVLKVSVFGSLATLLLVLVAVVLVYLFLVHSERGAQFIIKQISQRIDMPIEIDSVSGQLSDVITVSGVSASNEQYQIKLAQAQLEFELSALLNRQLNIVNLRLAGLQVQTKQTEVPEKNTTVEFALPDYLELPVDIIVQHAQLDDAQIFLASAQAPVVIDQLTLRANWTGRQLQVQALNLTSPMGKAHLIATARTENPYPLSSTISWTLIGEQFADINAQTTIEGSLESLNFQQTLQAPYSLEATGTLSSVISNPAIDMQVHLKNTNLQQLSAGFPVFALDSNLNVSGSPESLHTTGQVTVRSADFPETRFELDSVVTPTRVEIKDLTAILANSETRIRTKGSVDFASSTPTVDASIAWNTLQWPLTGSPQVTLNTGQLTLTGGLDRYQFVLDGQLQTAQQLDGKIRAQGFGDLDHLVIPTLAIDALQGQVTGSAELTIQPNLSVTTELKGTGINPQDLFNDWPGKVDFALTGKGVMSENTPTMTVDSLNVSGQLRDWPLKIEARGIVSPALVRIDKFDATSGTTIVTASGVIEQTLALEWKIESPDLNAVAPFLRGQLNGQGSLTGTRQSPQLKANMMGEKVAYKNMFFEKLAIDSNYSADDFDRSVTEVHATQVTIGDYAIDKIDLQSTGLIDRHSITLSVSSNQLSVDAMLDGVMPDTQRYDFSIKQLELKPEDLGLWSLVQPSDGSYTAGLINLSQTCLGQNLSTLCLDATDDSGVTQMQIKMQNLPVGVLTTFVPSNPRVSGTIDGSGTFRLNRAGVATAELEFLTSAMEVSSRSQSKEVKQSLRFDPSSLSLNILPSGIAQLNANFPLQEIGGITATARIEADHELFTRRTIVGELALNIPSLSFLASHLPQVSALTGEVKSQIDINGTIERPQFLGGLRVADGSADLASLGIELSEMTFSAEGQPDNKIKIDAAATSGKGKISISGNLDIGKSDTSSKLVLKGESFLVVNTPEAKIWVSPDVTMTYQNKAININGDVVVPKAHIKLDALPKTAVRVSKDQILIDSTEVDVQMSTPLTASLNVTLGDDVHFDGLGLNAQLEGRIQVNEVPNKPTTATGEVNLTNGEYEAYGQRLKITNGTLLFVGGPIDQPGIDIRATRKPTPDIEVGITARGSLAQPEFSIFSTPSFNESEQLAYLIFGRPLNSESASESSLVSRAALAIGLQGGDRIGRQLASGLGLDQFSIESGDSDDMNQATLVIGKYLSPRLFVSYGIGILEPISTLKLEYILNSKWRLITESSSLQSGADAQYALER